MKNAKNVNGSLLPFFFLGLFLCFAATNAQAMSLKRPSTSTVPVTTTTPPANPITPPPSTTTLPSTASNTSPASSTTTPITLPNVPGTIVSGATHCTSTDPQHICIGLKLVSYVNNGVPVLTQDQAITLLNGINTVWSQCNIGFQLEKFEAVDPTSVGLSFDTNWKSDGDQVRSTFNDGSSFLVVGVGSLTGRTIAVTEMPGADVYGTLVEQSYANNSLTVGHELGHYQGLYHVSDDQNLMNPYIGPDTETLTSSQCQTARATDYANWQAMMRN